MRTAARLILAAAVATSFVGVTAPAASANDCSNPKQPCGGCSVNLDREIRNVVECHPV